MLIIELDSLKEDGDHNISEAGRTGERSTLFSSLIGRSRFQGFERAIDRFQVINFAKSLLSTECVSKNDTKGFDLTFQVTRFH
ncbi:hypothetical protein L1987_24566 [Smallanthus sonchifolius]|uniref:Uncharacterized protein n=1 Tax=Smallanthus sonchifolius TaxID=185202 RepID=A0ACB9ILE4_9ASTR|nr:hypothetical protein L1987_24566 [Smallanthus sonchifolius]